MKQYEDKRYSTLDIKLGKCQRYRWKGKWVGADSTAGSKQTEQQPRYLRRKINVCFSLEYGARVLSGRAVFRWWSLVGVI